MRLHTNIFRADTVERVVRGVGGNVGVGELREHGSRTHAVGIELRLAGSSLEGGAYGTAPYKTATWDEWGIVLARLFELDPDMVVGSPGRPIYADGQDFADQTGGRFAHLRIEDACRRHNWDHRYERVLGWIGSRCRKCGAWKYPPLRRLEALAEGRCDW